jgi:hypothetical protein
MKPRGSHIAIVGSLAFGLAFIVAATDVLAELQAHFDHETNGVHKAKLLDKLADAEFNQTRTSGTAGDYNAIGLILEKYRDNVRVTLDALKKEHPDAERHSNGYRQLEINVRKGIHEVDEILLIAPEQYKPPIGLVRHDLAASEDELIAMLFPPHHQTQPPPPVSSPAAVTPPPSEKQP